MRSAVLVLVMLLGCGGTAFGQQSASFGVKAGVNFANLNFEGVAPANSQFALQAEALFSQKGAKSEEEGFSSRISLNYIDIPVLARFSTPASSGASFHVFAGPSFGFKTSAEATSEFDGEEETEDLDDQVKGFDLGLVLGAGVEFGRLVIDGRYAWGMTDINEDEDEGVKVKTRTFSIMAGFRF
jgi:Outer membrane protein beta-barrel domain